jgi:hypothetical protein
LHKNVNNGVKDEDKGVKKEGGERKKRYEELEKENEGLKKIIGAIPPEVMEWIEKKGAMVRIVRRDCKEYVGELLMVRFEPKELEVGVTEDISDYVNQEIRTETKIVKIPINNLLAMDFLLDIESKPMPKIIGQ